jgi:diguanylate cyclase (GGDEF)-like protein
LQLPRENPGASGDHDAAEWVDRLCRAVRETLDAERVIAWVYDAPAQTVTPYVSDTPGEPSLLEAWADTPIDTLPFACTVLLESRAIDVRDAQDDERVPPELAAELGIGSVRFEPLLAGRAVGMVSIEPASAAARPELYSLLPLLAAGVGRVASRHESDRGRREAEFLLELTRAAGNADSIDQMLAVICERVAAQVGGRRATIYLLQGSRLVARGSRSGDGSYDESAWTRLRAEPPPPLAEAAIQSGKPVLAHDTSSPLLSDAWARTLDVGSAVAIPLVAPGGRAVGALLLDDPTPDRFSHDDVRFAETAARHVAAGIGQALVSDERTSHLRAATAIQRLLVEGSSAVSVLQAGEVLARVTRDALRAERATLLLQDENEEIEHVISVGADGDFDRILQERIGRTPARDFRIWRLTTRQPRPIFVENARASRLIPQELVEELGLQSYVAVPLLSASRPLGLVLCSHSRAPRSWSPEERQLVMQIALEGSLVVENAVLRAADQESLSRLAHQAFHDSLTELPNRALFSDRLQHALDRMTRRQESIAVLFLDLDEFKPVNDTLGHDAGDRLLVEVGQRLQSCLRPEDTIARLGGDEFTVLLEDITDARYAIRVAERIAEALKEPFQLDGEEASVTASIGIAVGTGRESTTDDLVRRSDQAMYEAKRSGKARYVVFHERMTANGAPADDAARAVEHAEQLEPDGVVDAVQAVEEPAPVDAVEVEEPAEALDEERAGEPEAAQGEPADSEASESETALGPELRADADIEIHREPVAASSPPNSGESAKTEPQEPSDETSEETSGEASGEAGNGRPREPEPRVATSLSEARRRRRQRFPPR